MQQTVCDICEIPMEPGTRHHKYGVADLTNTACGEPMVHEIDVCEDCNHGVGNLMQCFIRGAVPALQRHTEAK